ncbi:MULTISPECIES: class II aldolase/adducin family protein [Hyphomicrobiales]|jgi:L-fuculose-phosphate aldolase|uniref:class II aldolase/adducin family protein n=1 Tax=Hyphomicrobiales TaxID=356 RepID=UPI0003679C4C|nr:MULTISPECIES: class II aldolase/adducin family protein [Phyllobacteriaceae]MCX8572394.1 class II aldolase/adducin family protein [Aminobacter sp. MET-1]
MQAPSDPRVALVEATLKTVELELNSGTAGNLSLRHGEGMLITPTGIPPRELGPEQIVEMDLEGNWEGRWKPSSEWAIHSRLYQTTPAGAVVHAHPDNCVALAALRRPMPPFHYMIAGFGGNVIPCAPYACFGTPALAETVVAAMGTTYAACLMSNHGIVTTGRDLASALARAEKLEMLARQYLLACSAGEPVLLSEEELTEVHSRYGTYGQQ